MQGRVDTERSVRRKRNHWLGNIGDWTNISMLDLFHTAEDISGRVPTIEKDITRRTRSDKLLIL